MNAKVAQLLADARAAVEAGHKEKAAALLDDRAIEVVGQIVDSDSSRTDIIFLVAMILWKTGRESVAEQWYKKVLAGGHNAVAYNKLGCLCQYMGRMAEALDYQKKALETEPDNPEFMANLARIMIETGQMTEGIDLLRKAVDKMPQNAQAHSNLLFRLHHTDGLDPDALLDEHKQWARLHSPVSLARTSHDNVPDPDRRLRIGYISPDFRRNSVAYFFESLLDGHNRDAVEVYGYGNVEFQDAVTERLKEKFDLYRDVRNLNIEAITYLLEQDKIDILVDLAGHTGDNCLLVLARKPAPIQVTYLGYPDTTGMEAVDYRLTDALAEAPEAEQFYTEELVFLPEGFLCYRPPDFAPVVAPLPADEKGYITFGSFNNSCKINPVVAKLWAQVLDANENSRLLLKLKGGDEQQMTDHYFDYFERFGISRERLEICGWKSPNVHLQLYGRVDIALDTYPYNGTTTTCEALWMGVPVISLVGQHHASRVGLSILTRVGLEFFAASTPAEYVAKATALATNRQALAQIRTSMRARIATSGLCHAKGFASNLETAYRKMWRRWCQSHAGCISSDNLTHSI